MAETQEFPVAAPANGSAEEPPKKKRGKPKDELAPPKPKNAFQRVTGEARARIKVERPELIMDLKGMAMALKDAWDQCPEAEKIKLQAEYEKEMAIWKPKWEAYKQTQHYKEFFEIRQDYIDKKTQKKLVKKLNQNAPKRPKSGYMIHSGEIRERVQKEVIEAGGGMGDIGKRIAEIWNGLSEAKKAEYGEQSARQKVQFDKDFAEYRKTPDFAHFMEEKPKLEARQMLKKIQRTKLDELPKKPPSAFGLYRAEVLPKVTEANKSLSPKEIGALVKAQWLQVPEDRQAAYVERQARLRAEHEAGVKEFKRQKVYMEYLEKRQAIKTRENRLVNLRELPKRPKSVFALFADEHKNEVEPGKGEGKGRDALKRKYQEIQAEEKAKLEQEEKEAREQWMKDVKDFKEGPKYKAFQGTGDKIKTEFLNDAMKVMTLRFLDSAPAAPPKSGFSVFVAEKRQNKGAGPKKSNAELKDEVTGFRVEFAKLDRETKAEYDATRKAQFKEWEGRVKEYMAMETWQEYLKEAKRLKVPVKSLLLQKKKAVKKLKSGLTVIPAPTRPDLYPSKPPGAYKLFVRERRGGVQALSEVMDLWQKLDGDGRQKYIDEAAGLERQYQEELRRFKESDDGKRYLRDAKGVQRRNRVSKAKFQFLGDMPKKPPVALKIFLQSSAAAVKSESPELKGFEIRRKLVERWQSMDASEKAPLEEDAKKKLEEYHAAMVQFRQGENWQKFAKAVKVPGKGKGPPPPRRPDDYPVKPLDALKAFCREQAEAGKGIADLMKMFQALPEEERAERQRGAQERYSAFVAEKEAFDKSERGRKYLKAVQAFDKRKRLALAKARFLKDEPKRPPVAFTIFLAERRAEVQEQFPDLKGIGQIQQKMHELWRGLSDEEKGVFTKKESEQKQEYDSAVEAFHKTVAYKKYMAVVNRLSGKPKKMKVKAKAVVLEPPKPENLPKKPPSGFILYVGALKTGSGTSSLPKMQEQWRELGAEGQKKYMDEAAEKNAQYEKDMKEFTKSAEGKKYFRLKAVADRKNRMKKAKERFLGGSGGPTEPKRPPSAYFIFVQEKRSSFSSGKVGDIAKQLTTMWSSLSTEERKQYESKAEELKAQYEKDLAEYKSSAGFKKYDRALKSITKTKKRKPVAKAKPAKAKKSGGRGRGGAGAGRGRGAAQKPAAAADSSDSDVMGSDSGNSSSDDSDSD
mmetsp:Transcript_56351/g.158843  ORF Transcript_56351/g.158843 Transcript_56351/m.158843 type:complete len:1194 (+) Transcript_56351:47-3628(+)